MDFRRLTSLANCALLLFCGLALAQSQNRITCASDSGGRQYCNVDTRNGVVLARQISGAQCVQGRTWGYDRNGIWVDKGCRAEFVVGRSSGPGGPNGMRPPFGQQQGSVDMVNCSSEDGKRKTCAIPRDARVRLLKQRSGSPCLEGRTWGRDQSSVWVDKGCRADFEVRSNSDRDGRR